MEEKRDGGFMAVGAPRVLVLCPNSATPGVTRVAELTGARAEELAVMDIFEGCPIEDLCRWRPPSSPCAPRPARC